MYEIDEQQIRQWWSLFVGDNNLVEIRLLGKTTYSGYFKSVDVMIEKLRPLLNNPNPYDGNLQAYYTLNKIDDALYSREQRDKFVKSAKNATTDGQVTRRTKVMIDLDPNRVAGVSSSDAELEKAHLKAVDIYRYLIAQGFKEPIITLSGSGYHLYVLCDMPADDEHTELVKRFLQSISKMFSDEHIECDEKVYNLARVDKVVGTWAKKGSDSGDRRWRMAKIVKVPQDLSPNDDSLFQKIADLLPKEEPKVLPNQRRGNYGGAPFDLPTWLNEHGIVYREKKSGDSTLYELEYCPWVDTHSDKKKWDSALFVDSQGKITFNCTHSHCKGKTWHDVRLHYEPNAYDRPVFQPQYAPRQYVPQPKYNIKEELPELGKKWLSLSDIKKVDLSAIPRVKTGITELDRYILGLAECEVTLFSGSNACVDCDTEYFNGIQWKKISDYKIGERVLQYNLDGTAELVTPQRYIKSPCDELYLLQSVTGVDQCVSGNHNLVYITSKGNLAKKTVEEMILMHKNSLKGFSGKFITTFEYNCGGGITLSDDEIRIMCAVICDGYFSDRYKDKNTVRINIKKARKKERLESLLNKCHIQFRKEQYNPRDKEFNSYFFHAPRHEKEFGDEWYSCSKEQLSIIADEILYWDGTIKEVNGYNSSYSSVSKRNVDFVQFAFASIGVRTSIYTDNRIGMFHSNGKYKYRSVCYSLTICKTKTPSLMNPVKRKEFCKVKTTDGFKYCFTVPSGMLVLRRNGNINITGNSGKSSFINTLLLNVINQGVPCALWSGELPSPILKTWIQMVAAGRRNLQPSTYGDGKFYVPNNIAERIDQWTDGKLFLFNNEYGAVWEEILHDMNELLAIGVKFFVLDNLMSLDIDLIDGTKNEQQKALILQIKEFAKRNNVHVLLVAHPRKSIAFLRKADISGTSDLTNVVDNVLIAHRVNQDFLKAGAEFYGQGEIQRFNGYGNVIEIAKNRMYGVCDVLVGMHYEIESRRFKNSPDEDIRYGWELEPEQREFGSNQDYDVYKEGEPDLPFARYRGDENAPF